MMGDIETLCWLCEQTGGGVCVTRMQDCVSVVLSHWLRPSKSHIIEVFAADTVY